MPDIRFPEELPITGHREVIEQAMREHPVVIVCGDTGSGKTTQLPKMAMELGRGVDGRLIGCTQPRRLAAVTVARRVAEEFGEPVGGLVGYQHRFARQLSGATRVKFMTDGILLAEIRARPRLETYDTLIIDEAHERSLNIDLLLGWIKRLLPRRPDLRVIISSATIDAERFSAFYGGAPMIQVPGRLHPIDIRYREPDDDDPELPRLVAAAIDTLASEPRGDVLVFLPGERDIRETAEVLTGRRLPDTEIIPLLASLPAAEQQRAFRLAPRRRVILATNVAETSVTIPGIRYVIDSGLARISRYVHRTQVQRLQIEPISQASANQRAGRCGRIGPGVCIRLYGEDDLRRRAPYTDPEILRSSLAGVMLTMLDLRLGDIASFPFLDPPSAGMIRQGFRELEELGAVQPAPHGVPALTPIGRQLARMPVEPRLGRMLLAGHQEQALESVLTIVAALAGDDPRRRPIERQAEADRAHAVWKTPASDFAAWLRLWRWWEAQTLNQPTSVSRRLCRDHFLSFNKMREWRDLRGQLAALCRRAGFDPARDTGGDVGLHRALLTGLLGRIGHRDPETGEYRGANGIRFALFPGSGLARRPPEWILAAELVDTARLFAREAAVLDPGWLEPLAGDLCRRSYHSPAWDGESGFVRATERVTLFGLVIVEGRRCDYSRINPTACRDLFIRHALVAGDCPRPPEWLATNQRLLDAIRLQEEKTRRLGQLLDVERLVAWFDGRLPPGIASAPDLHRWTRRASAAEVDALRLRADDWMVADDQASGFPDALRVSGVDLPLTYRHAYGADDDGITCTVARGQAALLRSWPADWLVPGALAEKVRWMLGVLPTAQRRAIGSLADATTRCLTHLRPGRAPLADALADAVRETFGIRVDASLWREENCPPHLRVRFVIVGDQGETLAAGRDREALLRGLGLDGGVSPAAPDSPWHQDRLTAWTCGTLPAQVDVGRAGWPLVNYPALQDAGDSVDLRLFADAGAARACHRGGVLRLLLLALGREARHLAQLPAWPLQAAVMLRQMEYAPDKLGEDFAAAVAAHVFLDDQPEIRDPEAFAGRLAAGRSRLPAARHAWLPLVTTIIVQAAACQTEVERLPPGPAADDLLDQLAWLIFPGFVRVVPWARLQHLPRYLEAIRLRLERRALNAAVDARRQAEVAPHWSRYMRLVSADPPPRHDRVALDEYRWLVEEFRVSCFAQELKTAVPVSAKRLDAQWRRVLI